MTDEDWVLLHAYGIDEVIDEVRYALLRQLALSNGAADGPSYRYAVVTDQPEAFDMFRGTTLPLEIIHHPIEQFREWRGAIDFVHRVKIEMIRDFCSTHTGSLLYLDSDAYPRQDLSPVFDRIRAGGLVMDRFDGLLDRDVNPEHFRWDTYVSRHRVEFHGQSIAIPKSTRMWIAGVIGFRTTEAALLDDVLALTDQIYPNHPLWNVEQLAFSFVLGELGTISDTEDYVFHYWDLRDFRQLITKLLGRYRDRPIAELVEASGRILPEVLYPEKQAFDAARPLQWFLNRYPYRTERLFARLGRGWDISRFDHLIEGPPT